MSDLTLSRRRLLKSLGIVGGGLVVGIGAGGCSSSSDLPLPVENTAGSFIPNAFIQILPDNSFRFYCARDEVGQGISTGLATLFAEELDVAPHRFEIRFAGIHPAYINPAFGVQGTGGSTSINAHYHQFRQAAANLRSVLITAAAQDLNIPVNDIEIDDAHILANGQRYPFAQFIDTAKTLPMPETAPLKSSSEFKYIGKAFPKVDAVEKSTGTAVYAVDVEIPNMHHAAVKHSPVFGGTVATMNTAAAAKMPGVTDIVTISSGIAVVAKKYWQAKKALDAVEITWNFPELVRLDTARMKRDYQQAMATEKGHTTQEQGDLATAFDGSDNVIENEYWAPMLAHTPLEPMSAVARVENGEADVWSGAQGAVVAQGLVARKLGLNRNKVRFHATHMGGSFGRRLFFPQIIDAVEIAAASAKPVHMIWSREADIQSGVFRPASLMAIKASVNSDGVINGWRAKRVGGNIMPQRVAGALEGLLPMAVPKGLIKAAGSATGHLMDGWIVDSSSIEGLYEDYDFPNREVVHYTVDHGLPLAFWRSVGHSFTAFAKESAVDELAHRSGRDVVDFRLLNSLNNPRLHNVIRVAGEQMKKLRSTSKHGLGIAAHSSFSTYVAQVAEVSVENGNIRVHKVVCVIDCGQVINPDNVRAQMEGAIMYGLTAALYGNLELENGSVKQSNFHDYPVLRMNEAPAVEVVIIDSQEDPTGVGEPGLPPIAPAVANAVFAATGQRLNSLPLTLT